MFRTALVVLATMACAQARPQQFPSHNFQFPVPQSAGNSASTINRGDTITPFGTSTILQQQAGTGGQVSGGGTNFGTASGGTQAFSNLFGSGSSSKTDAQSVQGTNSGGFPIGFPSIPGFGGFGSAAGQATSSNTQGTSTGIDGSRTTITSLNSAAGGSAQNGGTSVNKATGSTTSVDSILGSQTQSNVDTLSTQTSGR